ncbi:hypothetical protein [Arvimicrobium flavum]|uniref:hypothetical protein n=1 Tax=Arvimicrobium flavum TaxID=3393320 RepID=UPI00398D5766
MERRVAALRRQGTPVEYHVYPGKGWQYRSAGRPPAPTERVASQLQGFGCACLDDRHEGANLTACGC